MRFEKGGKVYKVSRVFGNKEEGDEVSLIDEATGLETSDYDVANLGEELFGIDSDSFMRTAFISQNDCVYNETTENIDRKLGRLVEQTDDNAGYDSIVTRLKKAISAANSRVQKDSLHNLKRRATELEEEIKHKAVIDGSINEVRRLSGTTKEEMAGLEEKREGLLARRSICIAASTSACWPMPCSACRMHRSTTLSTVISSPRWVPITPCIARSASSRASRLPTPRWTPICVASTFMVMSMTSWLPSQVACRAMQDCSQQVTTLPNCCKCGLMVELTVGFGSTSRRQLRFSQPRRVPIATVVWDSTNP